MNLNTLFTGLVVDKNSYGVIFTNLHVLMKNYELISDVLPINIDECFTDVKIFKTVSCFYNGRWHNQENSEDFYQFIDRVLGK